MAKKLQTYENDAITVTFDPEACTHSGVCLRGLPEVFDVNRRKWIDPAAATPEAIAAVVDRCPSGALRHVRKDEGASRPTPGASVKIRLSKDGPLLVSGTVRVESEDGSLLQEGDKLALCRCGGTSNPPLCDGAHRKIGYCSKR